MADPLSVVASSFAVVGVADIVLRTCLKCRQFLSDIEDAPTSIENLQTCLRNNTSLVQTLRNHVQDLESNASAADLVELQPAIDQFDITIKQLRRETDTLFVRCLKYNKMSKKWANVRHVLAERDIGKTTEQMERAKATLSVVLSLIEGKISAIGYRRVENAVKQSSNHIHSTLEPVQKEQTTIVSQNTSLLSHAVQQKFAARETRREIHRFQHASKKQHDSLGKQLERHASLIVRKLDDVHVSLSERLTKRESNHRIFLRGADRETALTTLLLMKEHVRRAVVQNIAYNRQAILQQDMNLVLSQLDHLVSSALQEAAAQHPDSTATSLDRWCYSEALKRFSPANLSTFGSYQETNQIHGLTRTPTGRSDMRVNLRKSSRYWYHQTAVGDLNFRVTETSNGNNQEQDVVESQVTFFPKGQIYPVAATARFINARKTNFELKLCTQLHIFRIVEDDTLHVELYTFGSVEDIDTAFRKGLITPYDVFKDEGFILSLWYSGLAVRPDILRYLDSQGVGRVALNGDGDALCGLWLNGIIDYPEGIPDRRIDMQSYLEGRINSFTTTNGIHVAYISDDRSERKDFPRWRELFIRNGIVEELCDIEHIEVFMSACGRPGEERMADMRTFLDLGMDPNVVDRETSFEHNALHKVFHGIDVEWDRESSPHSVSERKILEEKLVTLIEAGTAIHHCDCYGFTPSLYARGFDWWNEWCQALGRAGFTIENVLQEENNEWLQEAGWEEGMIVLQAQWKKRIQETGRKAPPDFNLWDYGKFSRENIGPGGDIETSEGKAQVIEENAEEGLDPDSGDAYDGTVKETENADEGAYDHTVEAVDKHIGKDVSSISDTS